MSIMTRREGGVPAPPGPGFERGTGFLLRRLGSLASRYWATFLTAHELTQGQYAVVTVLWEQGALGQQQLARVVAIDPRNIVAILDSLTARDLIERAPDPADGRRRTVRLTLEGRAVANRLATDAGASRDDFLSPLSRRDRERLNQLLQRLFDANVGAG